jgi:hypothetical protein
MSHPQDQPWCCINFKSREIAISVDSASLRGKGCSVKSAAIDTLLEPSGTLKANPFGPKTPQILPFR